MSLLDAYAVPCAILTAQSVPDGAGGEKLTWTPGETFPAVLIPRTVEHFQAAGQARPVQKYHVMADRALPLHAVLRAGETVCRIVDPAARRTPPEAGFACFLMTGEEWELP